MNLKNLPDWKKLLAAGLILNFIRWGLEGIPGGGVIGFVRASLLILSLGCLFLGLYKKFNPTYTK